VKVHPRTFQEGDLVLRKTVITNALREKGKLRLNWEGPYRIQKMLGPNTCVLQTLQGEIMGKTWNTMHLKRYFPTQPVEADPEESRAQDMEAHSSPEALTDSAMSQNPF